MAAVKRIGLENWLSDSVDVHSQVSEQLVRFDRSRRAFEDRLRELDNETQQQYKPLVQWMRQVVAKKAPELLVP